MLAISILLSTFLSLSFAHDEHKELCSTYLDRYDRSAMLSRNFLAGKSNRWPNSTIPYTIDPKFTESDVTNIKKAMEILMESTCLKFVAHTDEPNRMNFLAGTEGNCWANLGFNPRRKVGNVKLNVDSYCTKTAILSHEILHGLGFAHEHIRPDRDEYVKVNWQHIPKRIMYNWFRTAGVNENPLPKRCSSSMSSEDLNNCYSGYRTETFGVPYDYGSVMHYHLRAGASRATMEALKEIPPWIGIGQTKEVSHYDLVKINQAYPCDKVLTTQTPTTTKKPCRDKYSNCADYTSSCYTWAVITNGCKKTCKFCDGIPTTKKPCKDYYGNCIDFVSYCNTWKLVTNGCKKTCGFCEA